MAESKKYSRYFTYIQPILKTPLVQTYGSAILTFLALTIFVFFAIKPTVETILILQKKLDNSKQILEAARKKTENLSLAKQNYQTLSTPIKDQIQTLVPLKPDLKTLIQTLEQTAAQNQASISAIQVQPISIGEVREDKDAWQMDEIKFTFNVEGSYDNIKGAIEKLQQSARLISIDSISLRKTEGGIMLMSITGRAHYLK